MEYKNWSACNRAYVNVSKKQCCLISRRAYKTRLYLIAPRKNPL